MHKKTYKPPRAEQERLQSIEVRKWYLLYQEWRQKCEHVPPLQGTSPSVLPHLNRGDCC